MGDVNVRILHTSDWHLGHTLHTFDRSYEHSRFLDWLHEQIGELQVDALLIAGDVFDTTNPSAASQKLLNRFLAKTRARYPQLSLVLVAGNHDSPSRLEAPSPLLEELGVNVVGTVCHTEDGSLDVRKLLVPLTHKNGQVGAWCMAIPFLRNSDMPVEFRMAQQTSFLKTTATSETLETQNSENACENDEGDAPCVQEAIYQRVLLAAQEQCSADQAIIAMGHCHLAGGELSPESERRIVSGGLEGLSPTIFGPEISYVAMGHLHLAQKVAGRETLRYSGSPFAMSFSEIHYRHQVILVELSGKHVSNIQSIFIPRFVELLRIPAHGHGSPEEVLEELKALQLPNRPAEEHPYLLVRVRLTSPDPGLRAKIEAALETKPVRLAKIELSTSPGLTSSGSRPLGFEQDSGSGATLRGLESLKPEDVFRSMYLTRFSSEAPKELVEAFLHLNELE